MKRWFAPLLTGCVFFGGWEAAVRWFAIPKIVLPPPSSILLALWDLVGSSEFQWDLAVTLYEIVAGFLLGSLSGLVLGFVIALSPMVERLLYPYVVAFQTLPKVAVAPIIVIWFGYGLTSKIIITATPASHQLPATALTPTTLATKAAFERRHSRGARHTATTAVSGVISQITTLPCTRAIIQSSGSGSTAGSRSTTVPKSSDPPAAPAKWNTHRSQANQTESRGLNKNFCFGRLTLRTVPCCAPRSNEDENDPGATCSGVNRLTT